MTMTNGARSGTMRLFRGCSAMNKHLLYLLLLWCLVLFQFSQTTAEIDASKEGVDQRLDGMEAAAEAALAERTAGATKYKDLLSQVNELMKETERLEQLENELVQRTLAVDDLVRKANAVQLKYLTTQVNLTIEEELKERAAIEELSHKEEIDVSNTVTLEQLEQQTQPTEMMEESESQLQAYILRVMKDEITAHHAEVAESCSSGKCVTPVEAAQLVQTSLTTFAHDGVSMVDHAQGAQIVHELTSSTYTPPADDPNQLLGNMWWRKYVPEDWERILPSQWEEWKAGVPSFLKHSFVRSQLRTSTGVCWMCEVATNYHITFLSSTVGIKFRNGATRSYTDCSYTPRLLLANGRTQRSSHNATAISSECKSRHN